MCFHKYISQILNYLLSYFFIFIDAIKSTCTSSPPKAQHAHALSIN